MVVVVEAITVVLWPIWYIYVTIVTI